MEELRRKIFEADWTVEVYKKKLKILVQGLATQSKSRQDFQSDK